MNSTLITQERSVFRKKVLNTLSLGIKHQERFEELSSDIINGVSHQLVLIDEPNQRKEAINAMMKQLEEAKLVRRFHMMYESPSHNKQLNAALDFLSDQFKLKFSKYFL